MSRLSTERSPYLRHAAGQPIDWHPWGEEAFRKAAAEDKPIFLSSGAVWCHWCHVMAKESFEDPEVAKILADHFISVKLDRDERPDIDRRYQEAAAAAGAGGGWPLTAFLTPDGRPFYLGTYFPPRDGFGRPGFRRLLTAVAELYKTKREEIDRRAHELLAEARERTEPAGAIDEALLDKASGLLLSQFDSQYGGFGGAPKFPMVGALEFLMERYAITGNGIIGNAVRKSLDAMAAGGFCDQLGGGFHRYSVDEAWVVPHFEKMAIDNAWLLRAYTDGYALLGDEGYREVTRGICRFILEVLSDPSGGFYASQDADVTPGDEGGYFTWTDEEIRGLLDAEEYRVTSTMFLHPEGSLPHSPSKRVLFMEKRPEEVARDLGIETARLNSIADTAKAKLLLHQQARTAPFVDTSIYTSPNGFLIASFLHAFRVLRDEEIRDFALKSLSRILRDRWTGDGLLHSEGVAGFLDDHVALATALTEAYEVTGEDTFLERARQLADRMIERFWDERGSGFFDTEHEVLGKRLKTIHDTPHPSPNSEAIMLLVKLSVMTESNRYRELAEDALRGASPATSRAGAYGGSFFAALDAFYHLVSLGFEGPVPPDLSSEALGLVMPFTAVSHRDGEGRIVPCRGATCFEPIYDVQSFKEFAKGP